jgi:hypothetical protein
MTDTSWITEGDAEEDLRLLCDTADSILHKLERMEELLQNALSELAPN